MLDPLTADILKRAMAEVQKGNFGQAKIIAQDGLLQSGDLVALNAFLGMVFAHDGDLKTASGHLQIAHQGQPGDGKIALNLVSALVELGEFRAAFDIASWDQLLADPTLRMARYRAFLAQSLELFPEAVQAYQYIVARAEDDFESWNNLGNALQPVGDYLGSVQALERAVALDPKSAPSRLNLAAAYFAADRQADAETAIRGVIADYPETAPPFYELYLFCKRADRTDEAIYALEQAAGLDPDNADFQLKLGVEYGNALRTEEAEKAYLKAIAIHAGLAEAYLGLAIQYEHMNRESEFSPLIVRAEKNGLDVGVLAFLRALELRRTGAFLEALDAIAHVPETLEPERTAHIRATLLDRLGRSDEAFEAFETTAKLHQMDPSDPLSRARAIRDQLRSEIGLLTPELASTWTGPTASIDRPDPVFLVGFPRSGTTLLDTILMGHPHTTVLEEKPALNRVDHLIGGLLGLRSLGPDEVTKAVQHYFAEVDAVTDDPKTNLLIDKSPLFLQKVPLIQRLFPKARFILALRHPCDVLLSCFMSNFRLNSAMANFLRLEDAAEYYDLTFRHWQKSCQLFSPNVHVISYERMVEDMESEVRPLFQFLDLEWRPDVLDHQRTAKARGLITTASYSQVTEPIYRRASGRWLRYRDKIAPVLPILQPWIDEFGYETTT